MKKSSYTYDELINCGNGGLFGSGNAKLPLPPMLMFDRITDINENNGDFNKGSLEAELDIKKDLWFLCPSQWRLASCAPWRQYQFGNPDLIGHIQYTRHNDRHQFQSYPRTTIAPFHLCLSESELLGCRMSYCQPERQDLCC